MQPGLLMQMLLTYQQIGHYLYSESFGHKRVLVLNPDLVTEDKWQGG